MRLSIIPELFVVDVFKAVCLLHQKIVTSATLKFMLMDVWRNTSGSPILDLTWHLYNEKFCIQSISVTILDIGTALKTLSQLYELAQELLRQNTLLGSGKIWVRTFSTDIEKTTSLMTDLLKSFVGSIIFFFHKLPLWLRDYFESDSARKKKMDEVNSETSFYNWNQKLNQFLVEIRKKEYITKGCIKIMNHDTNARLPLIFEERTSYLLHESAISKVAQDLSIAGKKLQFFKQYKEEVKSGLVGLLSKALRAAILVESDRTVTISRALGLLHDLYENLTVTAGLTKESNSDLPRRRTKSISGQSQLRLNEPGLSIFEDNQFKSVHFALWLDTMMLKVFLARLLLTNDRDSHPYGS